VTNNGRLASAFSILEKPLYVCHYNKNYFEKYVSLKYPEMYFENAGRLCETAYQVDVCNRAQADFNASMSYGIEKNVYDQTLKCLLD